jgi:hypothetical protein
VSADTNPPRGHQGAPGRGYTACCSCSSCSRPPLDPDSILRKPRSKALSHGLIVAFGGPAKALRTNPRAPDEAYIPYLPTESRMLSPVRGVSGH